MRSYHMSFPIVALAQDILQDLRMTVLRSMRCGEAVDLYCIAHASARARTPTWPVVARVAFALVS